MHRPNWLVAPLNAGIEIAMVLAMAFSVIHAQSQSTAHTLKLDSEGASPPASITDVSWIAGNRRAEALGGVCEEFWTTPMGGSMVGVFRFVKNEKIVFYEIMTIAEENRSLVLKIKHFNPDLTGWEEKNTAQTFRLVRITPTEAYFTAQTYQKLYGGSLRLFVAMKQRTGEVTETEFLFRPQEKKASW